MLALYLWSLHTLLMAMVLAESPPATRPSGEMMGGDTSGELGSAKVAGRDHRSWSRLRARRPATGARVADPRQSGLSELGVRDGHARIHS